MSTVYWSVVRVSAITGRFVTSVLRLYTVTFLALVREGNVVGWYFVVSCSKALPLSRGLRRIGGICSRGQGRTSVLFVSGVFELAYSCGCIHG